MADKTELLLFKVEDFDCALPLSAVLRVEAATAISPLPNAPDIVTGVINVHGRFLPVMNPRKRLNLPSKEMQLTDRFILAKTEKRELALWVDSVAGVRPTSQISQEGMRDILEKLPHLSGVSALDDELVLIHDLEKFLTADENKQTDRAMEALPLEDA